MKTFSFAISGSTDKHRLLDLRDRRARSRAFHIHGEKPSGVKRSATMNVSRFGKAIDPRIPERRFTAVTTTEASAFVLASIQHRRTYERSRP